MTGNAAKPLRKPAKSLGRAERRAIRLTIRSISGMVPSGVVNSDTKSVLMSDAIAVCRSCAICCCRLG